MSGLSVGSTVWVFDENRRIYPPTPKGKLWAPSGPIYREHFKSLKIASETPRSWVLSNGLKVNKKTLDGIYTDEDQIDAMCWKHDHLSRLLEHIRMNASIPVLKEIAKLTGYMDGLTGAML